MKTSTTTTQGKVPPLGRYDQLSSQFQTSLPNLLDQSNEMPSQGQVFGLMVKMLSSHTLAHNPSFLPMQTQGGHGDGSGNQVPANHGGNLDGQCVGVNCLQRLWRTKMGLNTNMFSRCRSV